MSLKDLLNAASPAPEETGRAEQYILALQEISVDLPDGTYRREEIKAFLVQYVPRVRRMNSIRKIYAHNIR